VSPPPNESGRASVGYLQLRIQLLRSQAARIQANAAADLQSTKSFSLTSSAGDIGPFAAGGGGSNLATPNRPRGGGGRPRSVSFQEDRAAAYDFHGFHHVSDLHRAPVTHLMFAHNEADRLIAASLDGRLSVYQLGAEPPGVAFTLSTDSGGGLTDFDISTSNELLVSCSRDGSLCLWRLIGGGEESGGGTLLRRIVVGKQQRQGASAAGAALLSCRFLPGNNNLVVCGNSNGGVQISA
jgi:WD40 repeat protein